MPVTTRRDGATAHVILDFPPVNAIGQETRAGLMAALDWIEAEAGLERVILSGAGRAFAAGADAREFDGPAIEPHLPDVVARIEACEVPWIAAIRGTALGGGCELALACRFRIATPDAQIGLPEVTLGVVPGAGGTQRLPRLVALKPALDMIATGKPVTGERALALRLVDELSDDPVFAAEEVNHEQLSTAVAVGDLPGPEADAEALAAARATAEARMRGQIAPQRAIDLVEMSTTTPLDEAQPVERETFLKLRAGAQARALRHIFFAERGAKAPDWLKDTRPAEITRAVVVGGGTMGAGIAYALLNAGIFVDIIETDAEGVARAEANVENIVAASLKRGLIDEAQAQARRAGFNAKVVFGQLQTAMRPDTLLATNTSYLDVNEIAAVLDDPTRLVGLHFFAPAHIMKLLEIVRGDATSDAALATGFALARRLRKLPVLAGVCDGFIGNRILARYREAADTVMMDGSNPWEIDIAFANRRRQDATRDPNRRYIPIADRMVNEGRLGKKVSVGWYRYPGGGGKVVDPLVEDLAREEAHFAKVERQAFSPDEIRERLVLAMINEAAAILDEGIAQSAKDIDVVTVAGYGFPRWRGGLMHHADTLGAGAILARLEAFAREDPVAWQPADLIRRLAERGGSFAGN